MSLAAPFFRPVRDGRSYLALLYVLARLPLAIGYLLLLVVGIAVGFSTIVAVGLGVLVLFLTLVIVFFWAGFERELLCWWFGYEFAPMAPSSPPGTGLVRRVRNFLVNPVTWKALVYITLQIPMGLLIFTTFILLLTLAGGLIAMPLSAIALSGFGVTGAAVEPAPLQQLIQGLRQGPIAVLSAIALAAAGVVLAVATIHLARQVVRLHAIVVKVMLAMTETQAQLAAAQAEASLQQVRAERSEQSRRELIVNVSHELRTPIASIKGHVESLLEPYAAKPSQADQRRYLEVVRKETERLSSLVDDLLVVARSDSGELRADVRPVDVGQVARHVHGALAPIAERDRRVKLVCQVEPGLRQALADEGRLQQVMMNLVRNAITHTPEGGIVSVEAAADGPDLVRLAVADTGVGIPPEDLERIFERFYRTDASRSRATGGFGLGLGISRDLLQAMGGTIEVETEEGTGSRFTVRLRAA